MRNAIATKKIDPTSGVVTILFADARELTFDPASVGDAVQRHLLAIGAARTIGDSYNGAESVDEAFADAAKMIGRLVAGETPAKRGAGEPRVGLLVEALARVSGKSAAICKAVVEQMTDDAKKALRADARIKQAIAELVLARTSAQAAKAGPSVLDTLF